MTANIEQEANQGRVIDLQAGAHVMILEQGVFCIFHAPGQEPPDASGLPAVRVSRAPGLSPDVVEICTFEKDGWIGGHNGAALVRVHHAHAGVLITTYRDPNSTKEGPRLQVMRLVGDSSLKEDLPLERTEPVEKKQETAQDIHAHIQRHGDCSVALGNWMGEPKSQAWIEGFAINPVLDIHAADIEYQAVLGKGWLSPWVEGGHFCGSRGMSLPVLGLRVRLKGEAAEKWTLRLSASFTDGTFIDAIENPEEALEAETLAPLEAFLLELLPK